MKGLRTLPVLLRKLPRRDGSRTVSEWFGLMEDPMVIHGITFDMQTKIIDGRPIHTGMNSEELYAHIAGTLLQDAQDLKENLRAGVVDPEDPTLKEIRADITEIDSLIASNIRFPTENYVFGDIVVAQYGRVEMPLREYGTVDSLTKVVHVYGHIEELPLELDVGEKLRIYLFNPFDLHQARDGGMLRVTGLTSEDRMSFGRWLAYAAKTLDALRLIQQNKTFKDENKMLKKLTDDNRSDIGELNRIISGLRKKVSTTAAETLSKVYNTVLISVLGTAAALYGLGFLISALIPPQTSCTQLIVNATSGAQHCLQSVISQNPITSQLPMILGFIGIIFGAVLPSRFFRERLS